MQNVPGAGISLVSLGLGFPWYPSLSHEGEDTGWLLQQSRASWCCLWPLPVCALENVPGFPIARRAGLHPEQQNLRDYPEPADGGGGHGVGQRGRGAPGDHHEGQRWGGWRGWLGKLQHRLGVAWYPCMYLVFNSVSHIRNFYVSSKCPWEVYQYKCHVSCVVIRLAPLFDSSVS